MISGNILRTQQAPQRISLGILFSPILFFFPCDFDLLFLGYIVNLLFSSAKPGRVVGPVAPYENGCGVKEAYDPRIVTRNAALPLQAVPPAYCYQGNSMGKQERSAMETERERSSQAKQVPQYGMATKSAPEIAINIDNNPFYMARAGVNKVDHVDDRIAIDTNLLQAKTQFGGIGAAAAAAAAATATAAMAAHRKVGTVQYGMSRMY